MNRTNRIRIGWSSASRAVAAVVCGGAVATTAVVRAGDYYTTVPFTGSVFIGGTGATPADKVIGKEYSHNRESTVGNPSVVSTDDHDAFGVADPLQIVSFDGIPRAGVAGGNSGSTNGFDYGASPGFNYPTGQVDAIANHADFLLNEVIQNKASLLFSVTLDASAAGTPGGAHIWWEDPVGSSGVWASYETLSGGPGPGVNHHQVIDVDGLEVWGPEPPSHDPAGDPVTEGYVGGVNVADSDRFSLDHDFGSGTAIWAYDIPTKFITPWVSHNAVVAAVESAFLGGGGVFPEAIRNQIDVDALMARDVATDGRTAFGPGDQILFSIDPIPQAGIDGGEIIVASFNAAGGLVGTFLNHGGHLWDTAFDVRGKFGLAFEDIDALEAVGTLNGTEIPVPDPNVPEPASVALAALAVGLATVGRRKA